jgi:hypothetical protein
MNGRLEIHSKWDRGALFKTTLINHKRIELELVAGGCQRCSSICPFSYYIEKLVPLIASAKQRKINRSSDFVIGFAESHILSIFSFLWKGLLPDDIGPFSLASRVQHEDARLSWDHGLHPHERYFAMS